MQSIYIVNLGPMESSFTPRRPGDGFWKRKLQDNHFDQYVVVLYLLNRISFLHSRGKHAIIRKGKTIFNFKGSLPHLGMSVEELREKGISAGTDEE